MTQSRLGTALITGASSGIGAVYAERLARRGHDLILVARNRDRLNALAKRLSDETGRNIEVVAADLSDRADLARVEERLKTDASISLLVNNAGVGATQPLLESNVDKLEDLLTLNVNVLMRLTYAVVPGFVARGGGTLINIASIVGIAPELLNGVYGGSKAFVLAFSQSLRHELADKNVRVQAVLPGATATLVSSSRRAVHATSSSSSPGIRAHTKHEPAGAVRFQPSARSPAISRSRRAW